MFGFLDRQRTVAGPGFSRWMVPPAALCIHLCIGQVYALSVFNRPLTKLEGITESTPNDWLLTEIGWMYTLAIVFLGLSAATFGRWVEEGGPRRAMFTAGICWSSGFLISALGAHIHNIWLMYLGYGVLGGIGLGLGYISPVSTLIKWFPDRPGMATGMAIMGFGGGAFLASPLSVWLMDVFKSETNVGVVGAFIGLGCIYFVFSMVGAAIVRVPAEGWKPEGWTPPVQAKKMTTTAHVHVNTAWKTPQFWCIWVVLCMNVTAGIGVLGQASVMSQEMFGLTVAAGAGFVGVLSLSNMLGRFFLGLAFRCHWAEKHIFLFLHSRDYPVLSRSVDWGDWQRCVVRCLLCGDLDDVWRRFRDCSGVLEGHVRNEVCRGDSRQTVNRLGCGRCSWSGVGQLHPPVTN